VALNPGKGREERKRGRGEGVLAFEIYGHFMLNRLSTIGHLLIIQAYSCKPETVNTKNDTFYEPQ